jgi:hypothetical protein
MLVWITTNESFVIRSICTETSKSYKICRWDTRMPADIFLTKYIIHGAGCEWERRIRFISQLSQRNEKVLKALWEKDYFRREQFFKAGLLPRYPTTDYPMLSLSSFSYLLYATRCSTRYRFIASFSVFCRFSPSHLACREFLRANSVGGSSCVYTHALWIGYRPIYVHIYSRVFYVNVEFSPEGSHRTRNGSIKPEIPAHLRGCACAHEEFHEGLCNEISLYFPNYKKLHNRIDMLC